MIEQEFILQISIPTLAPNTLIASPNLRRAAYVSRLRTGQCVVIDDVEEDLFEGIAIGTLTFSGDSQHVAYVAGAKGKQFVVHDGSVKKPYDLTLQGGLCLGPTGDNLVYGAMTGGRWHVVRDGVELGAYETMHDLTMSPDGLRFACAAAVQRNMAVVVDGTAGSAYDSLLEGTVVFSPDSKELAYGARDTKGEFIVRNGVEGARYYGTPGKPVYSPDSKRLQHIAGDGARQFMVVDGKPRRAFDYIVIGDNEIFSGDSRRIAYVVKQGDHQHVAVDDVPGPPFDGIGAGSVRLSADGRRVAYLARVGNNRFVVCDEQQKAPRANAWGLLFSPDSTHLAYAAVLGRRQGVIVDDEVIFECDGVLTAAKGQALRFEGNRQVRLVALLGGALYSVLVQY